MLLRLQQALAALGNSYHYIAEPNAVPPYITWMEDGSNDLMAGNVHAEKCYTGSVHLFTKRENDPLFTAVPAALEGIGACWYLNSVQFETETGLVHYEWYWELV